MMLSRDLEGGTRQLCFSGMHLESFEDCSSFVLNDSNSERKSILLAKALMKDWLEYVLNRDQRLTYFDGLDDLSSADGGADPGSVQRGPRRNHNGQDVVAPGIL